MSEVIQTQRIELLDSEGKVRMVLGTRDASETPQGNAPFVEMYDRTGKPLVTLHLCDFGADQDLAPELAMRSADDMFAVNIGADNAAASIGIATGPEGSDKNVVLIGAERNEVRNMVTPTYYVTPVFREKVEADTKDDLTEDQG